MEAENMTKKITKNKTAEERKTDENVIYVRRKLPMSHILSVVTQFNGNGTKDVILKARGKSISTAVDTAEIERNRFEKNPKVKDITISTKSPRNEDGENQLVHQLKYVLQRSIKPEREHNIII
jgi:DNA-binding protein